MKKRPDIPILALEGSSGREILANPSFGLKEVGNISFMSNTQNPEDFYKQARVIIVPSFFNESYARVVAEAMAAGVPVVASNRGALPETVGDAGLILDIPQCYQPQTTLLQWIIWGIQRRCLLIRRYYRRFSLGMEAGRSKPVRFWRMAENSSDT